MNIKHILRSFLSVLFSMVMLLSGVLSGSASAQAPLTVSGWFTIVWGDGSTRAFPPIETYTLAADDGQKITLLLDEELVAHLGGTLALKRQRVTV